MPLLKISAADIAKSKVLEEGWYGLQIIKVGNWEPTADKSSQKLVVTFLVENQQGKEIDRSFSVKALGMFVPLFEAVLEKEIPEGEAAELDTDVLLNKKLDGRVTVDVYQGRPNNKCESYLPYGKGKDQKAPF